MFLGQENSFPRFESKRPYSHTAKEWRLQESLHRDFCLVVLKKIFPQI